MTKRIFHLLLGISFSLTAAFAQDTSGTATSQESGETRTALDGIEETLAGIASTVDALKKLKVSGYIQAQYQTVQTAGASSVAGGNFPANVRSRFMVRRGRIKFKYDNGLSQYVLQFDVNQNGVNINDAYVSVREPWAEAVGLTAGIFDRPFGFEVMYSSGSREMPERSRLFQTLFPGEREIGAKLEVVPKEGPLSVFNLRAGVFNGVRNTMNENDRNKDFIGRAGVALPFSEQNMALDAGVSLYSGKVTNTSKYVYSINPTAGPKTYQLDSSESNLLGSVGRAYYGADVQWYYDIAGIGGLSLRGEFITGDQPGTATSSGFYNPYSASGGIDASSPVYQRKFRGWYAALVQNIGDRNQFIARYDEYDPNTDVEGSDIGASGTNLTVGDVKFTTIGLGWIHYWDANLRFVFYYDIVTNENVSPAATGSLAGFTGDIDDNVFTLRAQFKF